MLATEEDATALAEERQEDPPVPRPILQVQPDGPLCGCGRTGCLEAVASRLAIAGAAAVAAHRGEAPYLLKAAGTDLAEVRSSVLAEAIRAGDVAVERIVRQAARWVGVAVGNAVNLLGPDTVVYPHQVPLEVLSMAGLLPAMVGGVLSSSYASLPPTQIAFALFHPMGGTGARPPNFWPDTVTAERRNAAKKTFFMEGSPPVE